MSDIKKFALIPHPGVEYPETIEADYEINDGMLGGCQIFWK